MQLEITWLIKTSTTFVELSTTFVELSVHQYVHKHLSYDHVLSQFDPVHNLGLFLKDSF